MRCVQLVFVISFLSSDTSGVAEMCIRAVCRVAQSDNAVFHAVRQEGVISGARPPSHSTQQVHGALHIKFLQHMLHIAFVNLVFG